MAHTESETIDVEQLLADFWTERAAPITSAYTAVTDAATFYRDMARTAIETAAGWHRRYVGLRRQMDAVTPDVRRVDLVVSTATGHPVIQPVPALNGRWVSYDDAQRLQHALDEAQRTIDHLRLVVEDLRAEPLAVAS